MKVAARLHHMEEYYFSKKLKEVKAMTASGKPVINIGIGSPDLPPPTGVVKAMQAAILTPTAHQYQSYQGIPELRNAIAMFYQANFKVRLDYDTEVLPLMGSKEGIVHISMAFLDRGDEVLIPNPGYATYTSATRLAGAVPKYYNLIEENGWLPDMEALKKASLSKVKLMWVCYPHMPTGAKASEDCFRALIAFAKENQILIVNDNPYSFILNETPRSILNTEDAKSVCLELNSLSKTFNMSGWRIGMVLGSAAHIAAILKVKSNTDSGMFYPLQKGAVAALSLGEEWYKELNCIYKRRREHIFRLASILGCSYAANTAGMFVWAKLPEHHSVAEAFTDKMLYQHHIFSTPGTVFGSNGEGYIRLSLCVSEKKIEEAIQRIQR